MNTVSLATFSVAAIVAVLCLTSGIDGVYPSRFRQAKQLAPSADAIEDQMQMDRAAGREFGPRPYSNKLQLRPEQPTAEERPKMVTWMQWISCQLSSQRGDCGDIVD